MTTNDSTSKSSNPSCFVTTIDINLGQKMIEDLKLQGFDISIPQYTIFSAKKNGVSCTLYQSGKLMIQGKEMGTFIEFYIEPIVLKKFDFTYQHLSLDLRPHIGIDESGKGDFFGPLCIAGVYANSDDIPQLKELGVRDSKTLTELMIRKIADKIRRHCAHHIVKINPIKYNELIVQFKNLNRLLAWGHATAIEHLVEKTGCRQVLIDQFANEEVVLTALKRKKLDIEITQRHRGEEDIVVAAASILARCTFVEGIEMLEKQYGVLLPKGASLKTISAGREFVRTHGLDNLGNVGKLHFKTLDSITR